MTLETGYLSCNNNDIRLGHRHGAGYIPAQSRLKTGQDSREGRTYRFVTNAAAGALSCDGDHRVTAYTVLHQWHFSHDHVTLY